MFTNKSFILLNFGSQIMCAHWKTIDAFSKNIFEELAEEGRGMYTKRVAEYEARYPSAPPPKKAKLVAAVTSFASRKSTSNVKEARQDDDVKYVVRDNNPGKRSPDVVLSSSSKGGAAKGTKPKRALSAYNLFFRFKRDKVLAACEENANNKPSKEAINQLILAAPGLEDDSSVSSTMSEEQVEDHRRNEIRSALYLDLFPKDTSNRTHRKSHGVISFLEMNKVMCSSWKSIDTFARSVFEDLAEEGKRMYEKHVSEHRASYHSEDALRTEEATSPPIAMRPNKKKAIQTVSFASMEAPGLCIDGQDLDSMPLPPLPNFPDNFDLEDLRTEEMFVSDVSDDTSSSTHDCPSHDEVFEDFPILPPFQVHETEGPQLMRDNKASADDFMKLIATLGDDCGDCVV